MAFTPESGDALVVVDVQRDFCPGGAWRSPTATRSCRSSTGSRPASPPWSPPTTATPGPFLVRAARRPWPEHCVEGTPGWEAHPELKLDPHHQVFKGRDREMDGYSGWTAELADFLTKRGTTRVVVVGLALDYCVQATALDARAAGYEVVVLTDATRAVNVKPDDGERALDGLRAAGVREDRAEG